MVPEAGTGRLVASTVIEQTTTALSMRIAGLSALQQISVVVFADNQPACSQSSRGSTPSIFSTSSATTPDAPTLFQATSVTGSIAEFDIQPSDDTGGVPLTSFVVQMTSSGGSNDVHTITVPATAVHPDTQSVRVTGLVHSTDYIVDLVTLNDVGAAATVFTTVVTQGLHQPGSPVNVTATPQTGGSVLVAWNAPDDTGGVPVETLVFTVLRGAVDASLEPVCETTSTSCVVYDLLAFQSYSYVVIAANEGGDSPLSDVLSVRQGAPTAPSQPAAPTLGVVAACGSALHDVLCPIGGDSLLISPDAAGERPIDLGGSPLSHYRLEQATTLAPNTWTEVGSEPVDGSGTVAAIRATGLSLGTQYLFRVFAVNADGLETASQSATFMTSSNPTRPGAPTLDSSLFTATGGQVCLAWTAPVFTGGAAVASYTVYRSSVGDVENPQFCDDSGDDRCVDVGTVSNTESSLCVHDLSELSTFAYRVAASSEAGMVGSLSVAEALSTTIATPATAVRNLVVTNSQAESADIRWEEPLDKGGWNPVAYHYTVVDVSAPGTPVVSGNAAANNAITTVSATGLSAGTTYSVTVYLETSSGVNSMQGTLSGSVEFTTTALDAGG